MLLQYIAHLRFLLLCQLIFFASNIAATLESTVAAGGTGTFLKQQPLLHAIETAINNKSNNKKIENVADNEVELPAPINGEEQYDDDDNDMLRPQLEARADEREEQLKLAAAFPDVATARLYTNLRSEQNVQQQQQHQHQHHQQQQQQQQLQQHASSANIFNKQQQQKQQQQQQHYRKCNIEITTKVPGICQSMKPIGSVCISDEYMDVFNVDCM